MPKYFSNITIIEITQALVMMMYQICMTFLGIAPTVMRIYVATFSKNLFTLIVTVNSHVFSKNKSLN